MNAPAEAPWISSKQSVKPSCSIAAVIPADTTPRMPPPSITSAIRRPSSRWPGSRALLAPAPEQLDDRVLALILGHRLRPQQGIGGEVLSAESLICPGSYRRREPPGRER